MSVSLTFWIESKYSVLKTRITNLSKTFNIQNIKLVWFFLIRKCFNVDNLITSGKVTKFKALSIYFYVLENIFNTLNEENTYFLAFENQNGHYQIFQSFTALKLYLSDLSANVRAPKCAIMNGVIYLKKDSKLIKDLNLFYL